jgi:ribonucleoside-diphosphate reductase alpha chain
MKLNDLPVPCASPLEPQAICHDVLLEKYAKGTESSVHDIHSRVSRALADVEEPSQRERFAAEEFLPRCSAASFPPAASTPPAAPTSAPR